MLESGVIMDVVTPEQARIAEDAGAVAVMALERVPADIRARGGVARTSDPDMVDGIVAAVANPVMAKARVEHLAEVQELQAPYDSVVEVARAGRLPTMLFDDLDVVAKVSLGLGQAMVGINVEDLSQPHRLAARGW